MPSHFRSPYGYSYFNPTGKEQAALTIGSLLAGALAASSGQSKGDAIRKGLAGTMAGYGSGYQNYQNLMGDAFGMDLQAKSYGQRVKEYEDSMGLNREKFAEEKRQYEEGKPERLAKTAWYNKKAETVTKEKKPPKMPDVGNYGKLKAQLAGLRSPQNIDYMGMPAADRAQSIADIENAIRVMEQYQPDLIPPQQGSRPAAQNAIPEGTVGIDASNNKETIFRNGRWEYAN